MTIATTAVRRQVRRSFTLLNSSDRLVLDVGSSSVSSSDNSGSQSNDCANNGADDCRWQPQLNRSEPSGWRIDKKTYDEPDEGAEHP